MRSSPVRHHDDATSSHGPRCTWYGSGVPYVPFAQPHTKAASRAACGEPPAPKGFGGSGPTRQCASLPWDRRSPRSAARELHHRLLDA